MERAGALEREARCVSPRPPPACSRKWKPTGCPRAPSTLTLPYKGGASSSAAGPAIDSREESGRSAGAVSASAAAATRRRLARSALLTGANVVAVELTMRHLAQASLPSLT